MADGTAVILIGEVRPVPDGRSLVIMEGGKQRNVDARRIDHTLKSVLMDESTAVAQLSTNMSSSVLVRRGYLMRYSR